jgi:hypothetical protein
VATYLDRILAAHRAGAAADDRAVAPLVAEARAQSLPRGFAAALRDAEGLAAHSTSPTMAEVLGSLGAGLLAGPADMRRLDIVRHKGEAG